MRNILYAYEFGKANAYEERNILIVAVDYSNKKQYLEQLSRKTDKITLLFDSCHSGHITRDPSGFKVRGVPKYFAPDDQFKELTRGITTTGNSNHVLLAACQADELATEVFDSVQNSNQNQSHGRWTLAVAQAIQTLIKQKKALTHRNVFESAFCDVISKIRTQHPLIEGHGENQRRQLFGVEVVEAKSYAIVVEMFQENGQTKLPYLFGYRYQ